MLGTTAILAVVLLSVGSISLLTRRNLDVLAESGQRRSALQRALTRLAEELATARSIPQGDPEQIAFLVPDRDGDDTEEALAYALSGGALTRAYNGGTAATLADGLDAWLLEYDTVTTDETTTVEQTISSGEIILHSHTGYPPDYSSANFNTTIHTSRQVSQYVEPVFVDENTTSFDVTQVELTMHRDPDDTAGNVVVALHEPLPGQSIPGPVVIDEVRMPLASLRTTSGPVTFEFSAANDLPPDIQALCIVVRAEGGARFFVNIDMITSGSGPLTGTWLRWTWDGITWWPSSGMDRYDMRFVLSGVVYSTQTVEQNVKRCLGARVTVWPADQAPLQRYVRTLNEPVITLPGDAGG